MRILISLAFIAITFLCGQIAQAGEAYQAEDGSGEEKPKQKGPPNNPDLPNVLIIGDSISLGYTPYVQKALAGKANVIHSKGNSQGTTFGIAHIDEWLKPQNGKPWAVIHFNFGLHDLKHADPQAPPQADIATYTTNLTAIVEKLRATQAKFIFATTTPFPPDTKPYREPSDAAKYNDAARAVLGSQPIIINDLYAFTLPRMQELQIPNNVHFTPAGSQALGAEVVRYIVEQLEK